MTITANTLRGSRLFERSHVNGGPEWFGYILQCEEFPRLSRLDRYARRDRSVSSTWRVDGEDVDNLDHAAERLNIPPALTDDEIAVLRRVTDEWQDLRFEGITAQLVAISWKGVIEFETGRCRLSPLGRRTLAEQAR